MPEQVSSIGVPRPSLVAQEARIVVFFLDLKVTLTFEGPKLEHTHEEGPARA